MSKRKITVGDVVYRPSNKKLRSFDDATDSLLMIVGEVDSYPFKTERIRRYLLKNGYAFVVMSLGEDCGEAILFGEDYVKNFEIRSYRGKEYRENALAARKKLLDVLAGSNVRKLLGGLAPKGLVSAPEKLPDFRVGDFVILGNFHDHRKEQWRQIDRRLSARQRRESPRPLPRRSGQLRLPRRLSDWNGIRESSPTHYPRRRHQRTFGPSRKPR